MASVEAEVCEEFAREAAFLWLLRDRAVHDAAYDLPRLCELDERLDSHIDGLRLAGAAGWEACDALLADAEGGEVFGATIMAIERWDEDGLARVLKAGGSAPDLARGMVSAIGWEPWGSVQRLLPQLLSPKASPAALWLGIAACAVHRQDPGPALGYAITSSEPAVRARALRAAGELGRSDLFLEVSEAMGSDDELCRFWAAWAGAILGNRAAPLALAELGRGGGPFAERSAAQAMRGIELRTAHEWIQTMVGARRGLRVPLVAAGVLGDPALLPWVVECMGVREVARIAGHAWTLITGCDLVATKLSAAPPEGFESGPTEDPADENVAMDPDERLPWPDAAKVSAFFREKGHHLRSGVRYLLGQPMGPAWLETVLRVGNQVARGAAAMELAMAARGKPLFEVRAAGFQQRSLLGESLQGSGAPQVGRRGDA